MEDNQQTIISSSSSSSSSSSENVVNQQQQIVNFAPSSSTSLKIKHDVFLSFRGEDTRAKFTSHLYEALLQTGVETFIDNRLEKGDGISQALIEAIQGSLVSVVIFSENYANSKWCLDEICMIMDCKRNQGQIVIPVFCEVDPSHVRNQRGTYQQAFAKHERDLKKKKKDSNSDDKLQKWSHALTEAANLAGWDSRNRNESEFIKDIVEDVLQKLDIRCPIELKGVVGIERNYAEVEPLLEIGSRSDEVRVIGIWGMGGIGKTTLARALYAKLFSQFEGYCFLASVREQSQKNDLASLRRRLFSELLGEEKLRFETHFVMQRLKRKKVLIVLDDVDTSKQLDELIPNSNYECFAPGSRVIVTTRDKHIFSLVNDIYEVKKLDTNHSLQLFCLNAFRDKRPKNEYEELSKRVIEYCKGNPLVLKVLGARLRSRSIEVWENELSKLQKFPDKDILAVLKLSYDGLERTEQDIFLDIAFFLRGESRDYVTSLLNACDFYATSGIENLKDKSLITISVDNKIEMHDLIQEIGWEIVHEESVKNPGRRSRLWDPEEVYDVLKNNKGTEAVEGIILDVSKIKELHLSFNSFTKMNKIRILKFFSSSWLDEGGKIYLPNGLESFPVELRHLEWHRYCLESLPSTFCAEKLVKLDLRYSNNLKKLWDGVQNLKYLKEIDLSRSFGLVELPDLSHATNLEVLRLDWCTSLREVHPSILSLPKLQDLSLEFCTEIESLEMTEVRYLRSLCSLNLSGCSSLKKFSAVVFSEKLETLRLDGTSIHELPSSVWRCENLLTLSLQRCYNLESLGIGSKSSHDPVVMGSLDILNLVGCKLVNETNLGLILDGMRSLTKLDLSDCCNLRALPDSCIGSLTSLRKLILRGCINLEMLPPNMKNLVSLLELSLDFCKKLVSLPELPPSLESLSAINLLELRVLPDSIGSLTSLDSLNLSGCMNLEMLPPNMKDLLNLGELYLDNCRKLVSLPELPPSLESLSAINLLELRVLPDSIGSLTSLDSLNLSGCINLEMLPPNMKDLLNLGELYLDNCRKLVSLPELPPSLEDLSAINCTSLQIDFITQLLPVVNKDPVSDRSYVVVPAGGLGQDEVLEMFKFRGEGDSITVPPHSDKKSMCRLICCLILPPHPNVYYKEVKCWVNNKGYDTCIIEYSYNGCTGDDDHVLLFSTSDDVSLASDRPNTITFQLNSDSDYDEKIEIKRCGVFPTDSTERGCKRKSPSFNKEESSRPEKHIVRTEINSNQTN